jgi:hypothetical protein
MRCPLTAAFLLTPVGVAPASAQGPSISRIQGTWRARLADTTYVVVIRPDSPASLGDQTVRWRIQGDSLFVALGEAWHGYLYPLDRDRLVLSGGDLPEPTTLTRRGPAPPRPDSVPLPHASPWPPVHTW